jgi:hypothetical protein
MWFVICHPHRFAAASWQSPPNKPPPELVIKRRRDRVLVVGNASIRPLALRQQNRHGDRSSMHNATLHGQIGDTAHLKAGVLIVRIIGEIFVFKRDGQVARLPYEARYVTF